MSAPLQQYSSKNGWTMLELLLFTLQTWWLRLAENLERILGADQHTLTLWLTPKVSRGLSEKDAASADTLRAEAKLRPVQWQRDSLASTRGNGKLVTAHLPFPCSTTAKNEGRKIIHINTLVLSIINLILSSLSFLPSVQWRNRHGN